jgi:phage gp46-like protein
MDFAIGVSDGSGMAAMTWGKATDGNLYNNVYLSLMIRRGSFFVDPEFGSRLHLLHRAKCTARTEALATEYCKEALQWLIDAGRASKVDIYTERDPLQDPHRLKLLVEVTKTDGGTVTFETFVEVV